MKRDYLLFVKDILDAMEAIEDFVGDMDFDDLKADDKTSSAVIRKFEVIGEAAKNIPSTITAEHPEIQWRSMAGMRDKLIHAYFGIDYTLIWATIKDEIPKIKPKLKKIISALL